MKLIKKLIRILLGPLRRVTTTEKVSNISTICGGLKGKYPTLKNIEHLILRTTTVDTYLRFPFLKKTTESWVVHSIASFEDVEVARTTRAYVELPQEAIDLAINRLLTEYRVEKAIKQLHRSKRA